MREERVHGRKERRSSLISSLLEATLSRDSTDSREKGIEES